jgi:hypothetical protein
MKRLDTTIALQGAKIPKLANTIAAEVISMILNGMEVQLRVFEANNHRNFAAVKRHSPVSIFEFLKNVISPPVLGCLLVHGGS